MTKINFTDRELDVMGVLWEKETATASEVRERLPDPLAYTTVSTVLRVLEEKGHVAHTEEGKAHRYYPLVPWERSRKSALRRMVQKLFRGSPELLVTQLVSDRGLSDAEMRRMRELLDGRLKEENQ